MKRFWNYSFVIASLLLPGAVLANVSGTPTLTTGQTLNLDTGASASSGGDILYNGSVITFQTSARGMDAGALGSAGFTSLTSSQSTLQAAASVLSTSPITPAVDHVIVYKTNGANIGAFLITASSSGSITIQFLTFSAGSGGPTITAVLNNYGLIPAGFTNAGITPGTLFIIKGTKLSTSSQFVLQDPAPGLPTLLNGATVKISTTGTAPGFYYAGDTQLALVMPSDTPTGPATVTVTVSGTTTNAFPINVVANNFGMLSADQTGSGSVKAVNPNSPANPYIGFSNSAPPGKIISIYGTGLGGDAKRDLKFVQPDGVQQINGLASFYVGGKAVTIQYQGPSGYPGLDQVNIMLPPDVQTGCFVSIVGVNPQGLPTNFLTMPIGNGTCQDTNLGLSTSLVNQLSNKTNLNVGTVGLIYEVTDTMAPFIEADAGFQQFSLASASTNFVTVGGCFTLESVSGPFTLPTGLSAGAITMTSPNTGPVQLKSAGIAGFYTSDDPNTGISILPAGFLTQAGGTFPVSATAGTQVGAFNTQINFPTPLLAWTNETSVNTVVRSSGVTVTWSGGQAGTYVYISGNSVTSSAPILSGTFTCVAPVEAHSFSVPSYVLALLPAGKGSLTIANQTVPVNFTATGLDYGYATGLVEYDNDTVTYQ